MWRYAGSIHAKSPDYLHGVWWSLVISGLFHVKLKGSYSLTKRSISVGIHPIMLSDSNNLSMSAATTELLVTLTAAEH